MTRILFVCHGNICRSTMAEFVMKDLVRKAGRSDEFGADTHHGTKRKLREMNIPFTPRRARQITPADYGKYDYIVIMDENNRRNMERMLGKALPENVYKMMEFVGESRDVKDPWYTGNFDETYDDVIRGCTALLAHING